MIRLCKVINLLKKHHSKEEVLTNILEKLNKPKISITKIELTEEALIIYTEDIIYEHPLWLLKQEGYIE